MMNNQIINFETAAPVDTINKPTEHTPIEYLKIKQKAKIMAEIKFYVMFFSNHITVVANRIGIKT